MASLPKIDFRSLGKLNPILEFYLKQIIDTLNGTVSGIIKWTNLDFSGSNLTDIVTRNHNDLANVQGGTSAQYYHLANDWQACASVSSATPLTNVHGHVLVDCTSAPVTVTLPAATNHYRYHIKKKDNVANAVTIARAGSDTFEGGGTSLTINTQFKSYTIYADGTSVWYVEAST